MEKGLGRAVGWADSRKLDPEILLQACIQDWRFDAQIEDQRGDWLWKLIFTADCKDRFQDPLLQTLPNSTASGDQHQLCRLAFHYAKHGNDLFRTVLYDYVRNRTDFADENSGEGDLLNLDGAPAFDFIANLRGRFLESRNLWVGDEIFIETAMTQLGRETVLNLMANSSDRETRRLFDGWHASSKRLTQYREDSLKKREAEIQATPVQEVISWPGYSRGIFFFRSWGRSAPEESLKTAFETLLGEQNPNFLVQLFSIFYDRPIPYFTPRLLELCNHPDSMVEHRAFAALKKISHPQVRAYALQQLFGDSPNRYIASLFIENYRRGDEHLLLRHLELPDDLDDRHWMLNDLIKLLQKNPVADPFPLGMIAYYHTPCGHCRQDAAKLLLGQSLAPPWLVQEVRSDPNCEEPFTPISTNSD